MVAKLHLILLLESNHQSILLASGNKTGITDKNFDTRGPLDKFEDFVADLQPQVPVGVATVCLIETMFPRDDL